MENGDYDWYGEPETQPRITVHVGTCIMLPARQERYQQDFRLQFAENQHTTHSGFGRSPPARVTPYDLPESGLSYYKITLRNVSILILSRRFTVRSSGTSRSKIPARGH